MTFRLVDFYSVQTPANTVCMPVCSGANKSSPLKGLGLDCLQLGDEGVFATTESHESPTAEQIAWAAGFFDGEGCILAKKHGGSAKLLVTVTQNDMRPLELLKSWFGGSIEHEVSKKYGYERYRWVAGFRKARLFLIAVEPYLVVKRERAVLALNVSPTELLALPNRGEAA